MLPPAEPGGPARLYLDAPGVDRSGGREAYDLGGSVLRRVRLRLRGDGRLRAVMDLASKAAIDGAPAATYLPEQGMRLHFATF